MTKWWYCPECGEVTDEFEAVGTSLCPKCELDQTKRHYEKTRAIVKKFTEQKREKRKKENDG